MHELILYRIDILQFKLSLKHRIENLNIIKGQIIKNVLNLLKIQYPKLHKQRSSNNIPNIRQML